MILYKPKSLCVYCPMGTMTQLISKAEYKPVEEVSCASGCSVCPSKYTNE